MESKIKNLNGLIVIFLTERTVCVDRNISNPEPVINLSIRTGKFPSCWKAAKVTPIFKSESRSLSKNY